MADSDGLAPWHWHDPSDDVISCDAAAAAALDDDDAIDGIAIEIAIGFADARTRFHVLHDGADAGAGDDCGPWVAMACYGHCVANATNAARLPDGHDGAAYDLAMPPSALAVCESQIEPF